jgi:hypothetical protein
MLSPSKHVPLLNSLSAGTSFSVIPAEAGIQASSYSRRATWMPVFTGMTD